MQYGGNKMISKKQILGKHFIIDLYNCRAEILNDMTMVKKIIHSIAENVGATVIQDGYKQFSPIGISGFAIISESHISMHTWPEYEYAAIDVFSCNVNMSEKICDHIKKIIEADKYDIQVIDRGIFYNKL